MVPGKRSVAICRTASEILILRSHCFGLRSHVLPEVIERTQEPALVEIADHAQSIFKRLTCNEAGC